MEPWWFTAAEKSTRGMDWRGFRSCFNCKTLQSLVHRPAKQRTAWQCVLAEQKHSQRWWETLPSGFHLICWTCATYKSPHIPAAKQLERARDRGGRAALCSFYLLDQLLSLPLHFSTATLWVSELQRKTSKPFRKSYLPQRNKKNPKEMPASLVLRNREGWDQCACGFLL